MKKALLAIVIAAVLPLVANAQASAPAKAASHAKHAKGKHKLAPSARKAVEEVTPIDEDANVKLTDADLAIAKKVYVGDIKCELGTNVKITPAKHDGVFVISTKNYRFHMHPVESRTGAIRLEDPQRGAMWLQLGNKSMLMSQKLGQRLADECQSPEQVTYAEDLKKHPRPSILDSTPGPQSTATEAVKAGS
jgi:Ni/Co efflux regulator RcnB